MASAARGRPSVARATREPTAKVTTDSAMPFASGRRIVDAFESVGPDCLDDDCAVLFASCSTTSTPTADVAGPSLAEQLSCPEVLPATSLVRPGFARQLTAQPALFRGAPAFPLALRARGTVTAIAHNRRPRRRRPEQQQQTLILLEAFSVPPQAASRWKFQQRGGGSTRKNNTERARARAERRARRGCSADAWRCSRPGRWTPR